MFVRLEDEVEVNIYIHGVVRENEEQGRGEESNTSGENFEDTDSEYEYKMSKEIEEKTIENEKMMRGLRPVICVDVCHLKGAYGGVLLSAVSIDPDNNLFPICYAVVMKENKDTWDWFLTLLKMDLRVEECGLMTFMKWDLSGIPCKHAISAIFCQGENIENYTHQCYRVEKYLKVYEHAILPINGRKEWKKSDFVPPVPSNPVKKGHNARTCEGPVIDVVTDAASQVMGRNEAVAEAPNEAVAESETIPQKLKVRRKGKEPVHKGVDVVMHRRTRSGYIPPTSAFKLPPKATATAPTMFEQFKQCQKG
ncbi:hypothetical protein Sango_2425800 [Sesamum angolense]|uniref:MULE transposase domain-containing protein n=1 Tax=Sesamum angolense TaxID=2727404 RepID=A0AAE1W7K2_9LAMI|nr:hypothetical protein Sango_2425800 [Sesamum angolense]